MKISGDPEEEMEVGQCGDVSEDPLLGRPCLFPDPLAFNCHFFHQKSGEESEESSGL